MTTVYFVRHAKPNFDNHDDLTRELSQQGLEDRKLVTEYLCDKEIDVVLSSPFKRAVDTVKDFADARGLEVIPVSDFRERRVDSGWIEDFNSFCEKQWADFDYKLSDGECLREVQERNICALNRVLKEYEGKNIVVGSHGTALSTIINFYDKSFGHKEFEGIKALMPWIVKFVFDGERCVEIQKVDVIREMSYIV